MITELVPTGPTIDRRSYLGASEIGAVAGLSPFKSALDVWATKTGLLNDSTGEAAEVGNALERPFLEKLYVPRYNITGLVYPGTIRHSTEAWAAATPDGLHSAGACDVQAKIVGYNQAYRWNDDDSTGADGIPPEVYAQVTWEMWCAGATRADVPALVGTDVRLYQCELDPEFLESLVEIGREFWTRNVLGGEMPEVVGSRSARAVLEARYPNSSAEFFEPSAELVELARRYDDAVKAERDAWREKDACGAKLCAAIGDRAGFAGEWGRVTWKGEKGRPAWKSIALELDPPSELVAKHTSGGSRVLRVSVKGT